MNRTEIGEGGIECVPLDELHGRSIIPERRRCGSRKMRPSREETRAALWTRIGCFILAFAIVFGFGLMVIDALPDP